MDAASYTATLESNEIAGWFFPEDALLFQAVDRAQRACSVQGDVLEIGCFHGKSAILLGYLLGDGEELVVCDLFGESEQPQPGVSHDRYYGIEPFRATFEANYARHHATPPTLYPVASTDLDPAELGRRFRIVHIDGSHDYDVVRCDLLLAKELLVPGGVVVFDDFVNRRCQGVAAAVWEGILHDGLVPMLSTRKLYATWGEPIALGTLPDFALTDLSLLGTSMQVAVGPPDRTPEGRFNLRRVARALLR